VAINWGRVVQVVAQTTGHALVATGRFAWKHSKRTAVSGFKAGLAGKLPGIGLPKKKKK